MELDLPTIKYKLCKYLWNHFTSNFNHDNKRTFSFYVPVSIVVAKQPKPPSIETI